MQMAKGLFTHLFFPARALVIASFLVCAAFAPPLHAQKKNPGTYVGTATVAFSELAKDSRADYRGVVKITIPLTSASSTSAMAELSDVDKPSATAQITHLESWWKGTVPESDGKTSSWTCKLAAPVELPMNAQGTLNVNHKRKTHSLFIALVSLRDVQLDCVHSRSGPFKKKQGVSLFIGTNEPGDEWKELPFADASRLAAKFRLMPGMQMKDRYSPVDQEWDFRLQR